MRTGLIVFFIATTANLTFAQFYPLPDFKYSWENQEPEPIAVDSQYVNFPAVVMRDWLNISVRGKKEPHMNVYFEHKRRIKIQRTENGTLPFQEIRIPESLDPFFDGRNLPYERKDEAMPDYFNVRMVFFAARRITGEGTYESIPYTDKFQIDQLEVGNIFHEQFRYLFFLQGLKVGDEIELHYKYEIPFGYNWYVFNSQRIFFHGEYPIQKQQINLAKPMHLTSDIRGEKPDSVYTRKKRKYRIWRKSNLPGCLGEVGIRPSDDLPHIIYSLHTRNPRLQMRHPTSRQWLSINYKQSMFQIREADAMWLRQMAIRKDETDNQWSKVRGFIARSTSGIPAHEQEMKLVEVHSRITNDFRFRWDDDFFAEREAGLERMGDYVEQGVLREISRYSLYTKIIAHLGLRYFPVRLLDSRIGRMTEKYHSNILFSDFAFAVADGDFMNLYYPKKDHFGYEVNEFPFYLAKTPGFLVDVDALFSGTNYMPSLANMPAMPDDNYRHAVVSAHFDTRNHTASGRVETELSGQFSTLTRSVFDFGKVDSSINPAYGKRIFDGREVVYHNDFKERAMVLSPYTRKYLTEYTLAGAGNPMGSSSYVIPMKGWFNFVSWPEFKRQDRVLPFYPDFEGADYIRVNLSFDQPVQLVNYEDVILHEENRYGSVVVQVEQPDDNLLVIKAYFNMYADMVPPDKAEMIASLYRAVEQIQNTQLQVRFVTD